MSFSEAFLLTILQVLMGYTAGEASKQIPVGPRDSCQRGHDGTQL